MLRLDVDHVDNPLRFQGQYYDEETGLHYNRHRYYNPQTGRYLTPDPIGLAGGVNGYLYGVNPTGWVDPLGLEACCPEVFTYRGMPVNKGIKQHMEKFDGFTQKHGVKGAHSRSEFMRVVDEKRLRVISETPGDVKGITQVFYEGDALDRGLNVVGVKEFRTPKTLYDDLQHSTNRVYLNGLRAALLKYREAVAEGATGYNSSYNGMTFRVYLNKDTKAVSNFHPSIK
nr:RHS repeat-associated core domain-containing protein [Pseudomonas sp. UFMG81]